MKYLSYFQAILPPTSILTEAAHLSAYQSDKGGNYNQLPEIVLLPTTTSQCVEIVQICYQHELKLTVRGGGSGVCGGAVAGVGGIVLSTEKMNRLLAIDKVERTVWVEAGMNTHELEILLQAEGLYLPQNIGSSEWSTIGGNVAVGSGSPFSLKYGVTADWVRNLEVVLPSGEVIQTGHNISKNATGLQLTRLFCGSEGKLGIVTKICLELLPQQPKQQLFLIKSIDEQRLVTFMQTIFEQGLSPLAMEFVDKKGMDLIAKDTETDFAQIWLAFDMQENTLENLLPQIENCLKISGLPLQNHYVAPVSENQVLWKWRFSVGRAVIAKTAFRDVDMCVPRKKVGELLHFLSENAQKYGYEYTAFGHIGNGNFHINLLKMSLSDQDWSRLNRTAVKEIFEYVVALGGVISGEHGIGRLQKDFLPLQFDATHLKWQEKVRKIFDEKGIFD